jgi:GNAT superfamily N-acetyltransferase
VAHEEAISMSFRLRQATPQDAEIMTQMRWKLFQETNSTETPEPPAEFLRESLAAVSDLLGNGQAFGWLAVAEDGSAVGNLALLLHARLPSPRNVVPVEGYVMNVWVEPAWRRKGIATALMEKALEKSRELGLRRVRLHATAEGRGAYARAGFVPREDGMELTLP